MIRQLSGSPRRRVQRVQRGASSVEYAILVGLIAIVIIVAVTFLGQSTSGLFQKTCNSVASASASTC
jgi:pilus assembly protein Flp/PilA